MCVALACFVLEVAASTNFLSSLRNRALGLSCSGLQVSLEADQLTLLPAVVSYFFFLGRRTQTCQGQMMVSTKRDSSCISGYHNPASKRPRTSSQLLDFQSQSSVPSASPSCSAHSSGTVYEIRGIVGERGGEYLIDWADDPVTGESFDADWVSTCILLSPLSLLETILFTS